MAVFLIQAEHLAPGHPVNRLSFWVGAAGGEDGRDLVCGSDHLRLRRRPQMGVADDANGVSPVLHTAGQEGIIRQNGTHAYHDAPEPVALLLDMAPGRFTCDPFGCTRIGRDLAIHRHGVFHGNEGPPGGDVVEEDLVQCVTFLAQNVFRHLHAVRPQYRHALSRHQRIWVGGADHHPADAGCQDRIHAGRLLSVVAARLQRHIHGGSGGVGGAGCQRVPLRVGFTVPLMPALSDNCAVLYDHGAHHGIGRRPTPALFRQRQGQTHIFCIVHTVTSKRKSPERIVQGKVERHKYPCVKAKLRNVNTSQSNFHRRKAVPLRCHLLSSRLYCRLRSFTESCLAARGLYHR